MGDLKRFVLCLLILSVLASASSIDFSDGVQVTKEYEVKCTTSLNPGTMNPILKCDTTVKLAAKNTRNSNVSQAIVTLPISAESASGFSSEKCGLAGGQVACSIGSIIAGEEKTVSYSISTDAGKEVENAEPSISVKPMLAKITAQNKIRIGESVAVQLLTVEGKPIVGEAINAVINGTVIGVTTDAEGKAAFTATRTGTINYVVPSSEYSVENAPATLVEGIPVANTQTAAAAVVSNKKTLVEELTQYAPIGLAVIMLAIILAVVFTFGRRSGLREESLDATDSEPAAPFQAPISIPVTFKEETKQPAMEQTQIEPVQTEKTAENPLPEQSDADEEKNAEMLAAAREIEQKIEARDEELKRIDELLLKLKQTIPKRTEQLIQPAEQKPAKPEKPAAKKTSRGRRKKK